MANDYKFIFTKEILVKNRFHKEQISYKIGYSKDNLEQVYLWKKIIEFIKSSDPSKKVFYFRKLAIYSSISGLNSITKEVMTQIKPLSYFIYISLIMQLPFIFLFFRTLSIFKKIYLKFRLKQ